MTELYSVTIRRPIEVTKKGLKVIEDLIETYHGCTWEQVRAYRKKFPAEVDITIVQTSGVKSKPRFSIDAGHGKTRTPAPAEVRHKVRPEREPKPVHGGDYGDLVTRMAKKELAE